MLKGMPSEFRWKGPGWYASAQEYGIIVTRPVFWPSRDEFINGESVFNAARRLGLGTPHYYESKPEPEE